MSILIVVYKVCWNRPTQFIGVKSLSVLKDLYNSTRLGTRAYVNLDVKYCHHLLWFHIWLLSIKPLFCATWQPYTFFLRGYAFYLNRDCEAIDRQKFKEKIIAVDSIITGNVKMLNVSA